MAVSARAAEAAVASFAHSFNNSGLSNPGIGSLSNTGLGPAFTHHVPIIPPGEFLSLSLHHPAPLGAGGWFLPSSGWCHLVSLAHWG